MIEFITGVPGSGKSYRGVFSLYINFGKRKSEIKKNGLLHNDVKFALTNINEIKLDKFEDDKVKKLDWDKFYEALQQLHVMYKAKTPDSELLPIADELGLKDCLIILDECHNYLDRQDAVLVWWLSYHRHLHQQIYLITQNLALVHSKYKKFSEYFYKAKPSSVKLFNNQMAYSQFIDSRMSQSSKTSTIKLPLRNEIFETYTSGANQKSQNAIHKLLFIVGLLIAVIVGMFFLFKYLKNSEADQEESSGQKEISRQVSKPYSKVKNIKNTKSTNNSMFLNKPIKIYCDDSICIINNDIYTYKYINFLKKHYEMKIIKTADLTSFQFNEYQLFISTDDFKKLFNVRSVANEKDDNQNTALPKLF